MIKAVNLKVRHGQRGTASIKQLPAAAYHDASTSSSNSPKTGQYTLATSRPSINPPC